MKHLSQFSLPYLPNTKSNVAIIIKMSPVWAKCAFVNSDVECFPDLPVVIFFHVQSLTSGFDRVDLVLDWYFELSLREDMRKGWGMGWRFAFTGNTKLPKQKKWLKIFSWTVPKSFTISIVEIKFTSSLIAIVYEPIILNKSLMKVHLSENTSLRKTINGL